MVFLPLTAIGDGGIPEERSTAEALSGGVESMLAYDELLARSALAGVQFPREYEGVLSTAATEVSEGALARGELARWEDLDLYEIVARPELATWRTPRRSYVWSFAEPFDEDFSRAPCSPDGRLRWCVAEVGLRVRRGHRLTRHVVRLGQDLR
ncbi:hypothetical protein [Brachybacterium sp. J153]|uniref:hypothetical protein n=1 Tax=Brachybacterium sp. J153 TaxID=3116488 RepID=UPI002E78052E|nr:hypothetical protein [Brachybacterium sp. J153]MEE1619276.1 hypothetical protein [Brachybacterium sp. J153]